MTCAPTIQLGSLCPPPIHWRSLTCKSNSPKTTKSWRRTSSISFLINRLHLPKHRLTPYMSGHSGVSHRRFRNIFDCQNFSSGMLLPQIHARDPTFHKLHVTSTSQLSQSFLNHFQNPPPQNRSAKLGPSNHVHRATLRKQFPRITWRRYFLSAPLVSLYIRASRQTIRQTTRQTTRRATP